MHHVNGTVKMKIKKKQSCILQRVCFLVWFMFLYTEWTTVCICDCFELNSGDNRIITFSSSKYGIKSHLSF